ncbi:hypothetical protein [Variovorax sp. CY25R-8]|uniref:hypothetical protein n=1 Tax=Variovorax sp. CY25R-8 TaxID=2855501 RepID=UPI0021BAE395|nr:hypothetical protein [Variovorax sp. CY25R-8]MCT8176735.1 hypothetical protein [Variovorax sp. CY25R-8]
MYSINRRDSLLLLAGGLTGSTAMTETNAQTQSKKVVDDGVSEITPVYVMTHNESQSHTFVRADFYSYDTKKDVRLLPGASIKVNGFELQRDPKELVSYIGKIPTSRGLLTFEFARTPGRVIEHSFALPELEIVEFPRTYRAGETLKVRVNPGPPRAGGMRDTHRMAIYAGNIYYPFDQKPAAEQEIVFDPIHKKIELPIGSVKANIFRQQRTPLKNISNEFQSGWAVASRSRDFKMEVVK